jgi:hypothetical protein
LRISQTVDGATFTPSTSSSPWVLSDQAQHRGADRVHCAWPPDPLGPAALGVSARHQVPVPSEQGVRFDDQVQVPQHTLGQMVQQRREQGSIAGCEPYSVRAQLPLQDGELMPQRQDLRILVAVAHRQQPQHREGVRHSQVGQSQQHDRSP